MTYYTIYKSPLGNILLTSDKENIIGLSIDGQSNYIIKKEFVRKDDLEVFINAFKWLDTYFIGEEPRIKIPTKLVGTTFQKQVWQYLKNVPYGKTATYKDIGNYLIMMYQKDKISYRAIGQAVGKNPISIIIPCHRIIGSNKKLTGYNGGLHLKKYLLNLENKNSNLI